MSARSFHAESWYELHGQPVAHITTNPYLPELWDPWQLMGETVEIDGQQYRVKSVETFMIYRASDSPYRLGFGLLVTDPATELCQ